MAQLRDRCGLVALVDDGDDGGYAMLDGDRQIVYQPPAWGRMLSLVYRYGLFPLLRLRNFLAHLMESFAQIYPQLEAGKAGAYWRRVKLKLVY
jgi:hypothetical protein